MLFCAKLNRKLPQATGGFANGVSWMYICPSNQENKCVMNSVSSNSPLSGTISGTLQEGLFLGYFHTVMLCIMLMCNDFLREVIARALPSPNCSDNCGCRVFSQQISNSFLLLPMAFQHLARYGAAVLSPPALINSAIPLPYALFCRAVQSQQQQWKGRGHTSGCLMLKSV